MELGGGLEWTLPSGLSVEARGRTLAAHAGDAKEWGVSGSARLSPGADGRGLSFELAPRWGASESGLGRLWEDGAAGRASPVGGPARLRLDTELGYGYRVRGGVLTPYGGFGYEQGGARRYRLGMRLDLGGALDLGLEARREEGRLDTDHGIAVHCASGGKGARLAGRPLVRRGGRLCATPPVDYECYEGAVHGFPGMGKALPHAERAIERVCAAFA